MFHLVKLQSGLHPLMSVNMRQAAAVVQITIADLKLKACKAMGLEEGDVRIWDYWSLQRHALLEKRMDDTAQAAKIYDSQDIFLEERVRGMQCSVTSDHPDTTECIATCLR